MNKINYTSYGSASKTFGLYKKIKDTSYDYMKMLVAILESDNMIDRRVPRDLIEAVAERLSTDVANAVIDAED